MISVDAALSRLFALVSPPEHEDMPLAGAAGRVLIRGMAARRNQPPFAAASMDGYALRGIEAEQHAQFQVIGEAAAGHRFSGHVGPGQAVRIFTGAPIPDGADRVVIQEDVTRSGALMTISDPPEPGPFIRPEGADFRAGETLAAPRRLRPQDIALLAAMNLAALPVARRPHVALLSTGDELVLPGDTPGPDQIIASNTYGLKAMIEGAGGVATIAPPVPDRMDALCDAFDAAGRADLIVTIGGASVGDHDLVARAAAQMGAEQAFYKVAMRPGKPLMAGRIGDAILLGLPGNPVSAMVCGAVFMLPLLAAMQGLAQRAAPMMSAPLDQDIGPNGPREHYMRARLVRGAIAPLDRQDSALLSVLAAADALMIRPPNDPARKAGEIMRYLPM